MILVFDTQLSNKSGFEEVENVNIEKSKIVVFKKNSTLTWRLLNGGTTRIAYWK